jgi:ferredoxin/flavodoxin---NADP+ reductase
LADFGDDHADKLAEWLLSRQPKLVTDAHWEMIDRFERETGEPHGRPRVKLSNLAKLLHIGHG